MKTWGRITAAVVAFGVFTLLAAACGDDSDERNLETTAPAAATATSQVTAPTAEPTEPSATGRIAFVSDRDGNDEIYVMNDDGSGQTNLTNNPAVDRDPAWSPDGSRIAFTSDRDGNFEIYVMNTDGTGVTNLTSNAGGSPAWSRDGSRIAFASGGDLYVMNADGSGQTKVTPDPAGVGSSLIDVAWSPDFSRIAVVSTAGASNTTISVMNADGSNSTNLAGLSFYASPAWSADGSRVAFVEARVSRFNPETGEFDLGISTPPTIYVINADGSDLTALTDDPADDADPAWSADDSRIAFSSLRDDQDPSTCSPLFSVAQTERTCNSEIYVMNADGSGQTRLTNNPAWDREPAWSPAP